MAITIEPAFLAEIKKHIRILHSEDDDLITNEIHVSILNLFQMFLLKPESDIPTTTNDLTERQKLFVKHSVAMYRQNPDERIESKYTPQNKRLLENILGAERNYFEEY